MISIDVNGRLCESELGEKPIEDHNCNSADLGYLTLDNECVNNLLYFFKNEDEVSKIDIYEMVALLTCLRDYEACRVEIPTSYIGSAYSSGTQSYVECDITQVGSDTDKIWLLLFTSKASYSLVGYHVLGSPTGFGKFETAMRKDISTLLQCNIEYRLYDKTRDVLMQ